MNLSSIARTTLLGLSILAVAACGNSPTDSSGFDIVSPTSGEVTVEAGDSLRFEVRVSGGFRVEFVVDNTLTVPGPVFFFEPTAPTHTIVARIFSPEVNVPPITRVFNVTVTGNLAPVIEEFTLSPTTGEAVRDEFVARVRARDPDGAVQTATFDFGDGTQPEVVTGPAQTFEARHVYAGPGSFEVNVTVTDGGGETRSETLPLQVVPLNQAPTGSLDARRGGGGDPTGTAPLTVTLQPQGSDPDGAIVRWEIDPGDGSGFQEVASGQALVHDYAFDEDSYTPRLRLTDDDDAVTIVTGPEITVFRDIALGNTTISAVAGNPRFQNGNLAPAVWSTGVDPFTFTVRVANSSGESLTNVPVRVISLRPRLVSPDGTVLPVTQFLLNPSPAGNLAPGQIDPEQILGVVRTDGNGRAPIQVGTNTSTRLNRIDEPTKFDFEAFELAVEVSRGHGEWVPIGSVRDLDAESTVLFSGGGISIQRVRPNGICPGDQIQIEVFVEQRQDAPGGAIPAADRYVVPRFGTTWIGATPVPEYSDWRTDSQGRIVFSYVPSRSDDDRAFRTWVDGLATEALGLLALLPPSACGGV